MEQLTPSFPPLLLRLRRLAVYASAMVMMIASTVSAQVANDQVTVVAKEAQQRVDVVVGGKPFTSYIYPSNIQKPILFPLRSARGITVTRGFPLEPRSGERGDHPHQVGAWFNYGDVNGIDFWGNSYAMPKENAPHLGTILHRKIKRVHSGKGRGELEVTADWVAHDGTILLREDTRFVFRAAPEMRAVDRITTWHALDQKLTFKDTKEGAFAIRVARSLEQPSKETASFIDAHGQLAEVPKLDNAGVTGLYHSSEGKSGDDVWGTRARWMMLSGEVEGEPVTLAIFDDPKNLNYPTFWHARGYGLFAANPFGQKDFTGGKEELNYTLAPHQSVTFRYRILILSGRTASPAQVEKEYQQFLAQKNED